MEKCFVNFLFVGDWELLHWRCRNVALIPSN